MERQPEETSPMRLWDSDLKLWRVTFEIKDRSEARSYGRGEVFVVAGDQEVAQRVARELAFSGGGFGQRLSDGSLALDHLVVGVHELELVATTEVSRVDGIAGELLSKLLVDPRLLCPSR